MTFVITQQMRGMKFEASRVVVKIQAPTLAEAIAKAGAALRLLAVD